MRGVLEKIYTSGKWGSGSDDGFTLAFAHHPRLLDQECDSDSQLIAHGMAPTVEMGTPDSEPIFLEGHRLYSPAGP